MALEFVHSVVTHEVFQQAYGRDLSGGQRTQEEIQALGVPDQIGLDLI